MSGGDENRQVDCSQDMLVVRIDNSPGKESDMVEVEYDDTITAPAGTPSTSCAQTSTDELWWDEEADDAILLTGLVDDSDLFDSLTDEQSNLQLVHNGNRVNQDEEEDHLSGRQSSHITSQGDTDDWVDCSDDEEFYASNEELQSLSLEDGDVVNCQDMKIAVDNKKEEDDMAARQIELEKSTISEKEKSEKSSESTPRVSSERETTPLRLECQKPVQQTSPTSPFSPEMMKTPPGHVKVDNWAVEVADNSPSALNKRSPDFAQSKRQLNLSLENEKNCDNEKSPEVSNQETLETNKVAQSSSSGGVDIIVMTAESEITDEHNAPEIIRGQDDMKMGEVTPNDVSADTLSDKQGGKTANKDVVEESVLVAEESLGVEISQEVGEQRDSSPSVQEPASVTGTHKDRDNDVQEQGEIS